jgi:hypothetical protein
MTFKLDFEQRQQAEQLIEQIADGGNYERAIYELIALRALTKQLLNASHRALCLIEATIEPRSAKRPVVTPTGDALRAAVSAALECGFAPDWDKALP